MRSGINLHWFRNFKTGDAPGFDIQIDGDKEAGLGFETFAYLWNWVNDDYLNNAPFKECLNSQTTPAYYTTPVTKAAWDKVYVEPAPMPTPEPTPVINWEDDHNWEVDHNWEDDHEEGSSTDGIMGVFGWIGDMAKKDTAGSLSYAATAAVATSAFLLH